LQLEGTKGKYSGHLVVKGPYSFEWKLAEYPLVNEWFERVKKGEQLIQTVTFPKIEQTNVFKSLLKAAYLYCFSTWGYDFVYNETGRIIREVLFENKPHILSNYGIFFHMKDQYPPDGLCYIFKPLELQSFMVNMRLHSPEPGFDSFYIFTPYDKQFQFNPQS
jgi:hypothetical protein